MTNSVIVLPCPSRSIHEEELPDTARCKLILLVISTLLYSSSFIHSRRFTSRQLGTGKVLMEKTSESLANSCSGQLVAVKHQAPDVSSLGFQSCNRQLSTLST